jgi:hypothetical protein
MAGVMGAEMMEWREVLDLSLEIIFFSDLEPLLDM